MHQVYFYDGFDRATNGNVCHPPSFWKKTTRSPSKIYLVCVGVGARGMSRHFNFSERPIRCSRYCLRISVGVSKGRRQNGDLFASVASSPRSLSSLFLLSMPKRHALAFRFTCRRQQKAQLKWTDVISILCSRNIDAFSVDCRYEASRSCSNRGPTRRQLRANSGVIAAT